MPSYEIIGHGGDTGRKRTKVYKAYNESEAIAAAENEGTMVDSISRLPDDPPTDAQLAYAADLRIGVPQNATKWEVRDLISCCADNDKPSTERHRWFANLYRVECTCHTGKKDLFDRIFAHLKTPGREKEMASWFTYRVYRRLVNGMDNAPVTAPDAPIIQDIAAILVEDTSAVASMRRYDGRDLIWFGQWTSPDGYQHEGGSNRTIAYKQASMMLREKLGITKPAGEMRHQDPSNAKGCMGAFALFIVCSLVAAVLIALHV